MGRRGSWADQLVWWGTLDSAEKFLAVVFGLPFALLLLAFLGGMLYFGLAAGGAALQAWGWQARHERGTTAAYAGTAAKDLSLARQALQRGDAAGAEARASSARDKLDAPHFGGRSAPVKDDLKSLEESQAERFRPIRRKRAMDRLGREGAEVHKK